MSVSEPGKIITPWAESGLKNTIPPAANPATGRAGFDQGFSAINMTAKEAGGIPPFGQDFNGIFYEVTNILRYMQAGGQPTFDAAMATAIGGYPKGAMVLGSDGVAIYTNRVDGNSSNPNSGGSGWAREDLMLREALRRSYAEAGYNLVDGSFELGGTINTAADVLLYESTGVAYSWEGLLPKNVPAGSTPETTGGVIAGAWRPRTDVTLRGELAEGSGATLVNTIQPVPGAIKRAVMGALRERISLLDFMTPAQRDAVYSGADVDHQSAFTAAMAWLAGGGKTLHIPYGTYNFTDTFDAPRGSCVIIDPKVTLKFTSTTLNVIRIRRGVMFHGNMAKLRMTNPAWDGIAVLFNGEDQFSLEEPCFGSGLDIDSAAPQHGTCINVEALNPRHYVMFVNFRGWTFGFNMNYGITFRCGSSGTSDPATWHWITSNTFSDINSFAFHFSSFVGLSVTPAEIGGNNILNFHHQSHDGSGLPIYFSGGHGNNFDGYVWDWDNSVSSPIFFEGGAEWNQVHTNVDTSIVKATGGVDAYRNKVFDHTGGETGQKYFFGTVDFYNITQHGQSGVSGKYASIYYPDTAGLAVFWSKVDASKYSFGVGAPYAGTETYNIDATGRFTIGGGGNPSQTRFRVNGEVSKNASTVRVGTDGFGGTVFENSAGAVAGVITVNTSSVVYSTISDYRLKDNVAPINGSGEFIDRLRPVTWDWKLDGSPGAGFIAHELQAVSPSSVSGEKDAVQEVNDENGNGTGAFVPLYQSVEYGSAEVIANLVAEVQSLRARLLSLGV